MDLTGLEKKKALKPAAAKLAAKRATAPKKPRVAAVAAPAALDPTPIKSGNNLHKTVRGERVPRQFKLTAETSLEFDLAATEHGYNKRQGSEFFEDVWAYYKQSH